MPGSNHSQDRLQSQFQEHAMLLLEPFMPAGTEHPLSASVGTETAPPPAATLSPAPAGGRGSETLRQAPLQHTPQSPGGQRPARSSASCRKEDSCCPSGEHLPMMTLNSTDASPQGSLEPLRTPPLQGDQAQPSRGPQARLLVRPQETLLLSGFVSSLLSTHCVPGTVLGPGQSLKHPRASGHRKHNSRCNGKEQGSRTTLVSP